MDPVRSSPPHRGCGAANRARHKGYAAAVAQSGFASPADKEIPFGSFACRAVSFAEGERFINLSRDFQLAVAPLHFIPVVESIIESKHAVTTRLHKRSTHAGPVQVSLYNRMVILERRFEREVSCDPANNFFDRMSEALAVSRRLGAMPAKLGLQRHPLLVELENRRGRQDVSAFLQKPLTAAVYRTDMDSQFMSLAEARKQHSQYHKRNQEEMKAALADTSASGRQGPLSDVVRQGLILDHFRFLGEVKPSGGDGAVLFSLPASSSFALQGLSDFFSRPEQGAMKPQQDQALECDHEGDGDDSVPYFFTLTKAKPSNNKRMYVHPGAAQSLKADHVAIALRPASCDESGQFIVSAQRGSKEHGRDTLAIVTSLGKCASEIESDLKMWSVAPNLRYSFPGVSENMNRVVTKMVVEGYRVDKDGFHVPGSAVESEADSLCKQGLMVSNSTGGYALTTHGMKTLAVQWCAVEPCNVCSIRDGLDPMQLSAYELLLKLEAMAFQTKRQATDCPLQTWRRHVLVFHTCCTSKI